MDEPYDYKSLFPLNFEELKRDFLKAEWYVALEAFKSARDQGINLRYAPLKGGTTIVQCKHYASSSITNLLSHFRSSDLPRWSGFARSAVSLQRRGRFHRSTKTS